MNRIASVLCAVLLLAFGARVAPAAVRAVLPQTYDAVVDASYRGAEGARVEGSRRYRTIGAALADAPRDPALRYVVFIRAGRYREKLSVDRPHVTLKGEDRDRTVITSTRPATPRRRAAERTGCAAAGPCASPRPTSAPRT